MNIMFNEFNNYCKWFALHGYDYTLHSGLQGFKMTAVLRDSPLTLHSDFFASPQEAMQSLYVTIKGLSQDSV